MSMFIYTVQQLHVENTLMFERCSGLGVLLARHSSHCQDMHCLDTSVDKQPEGITNNRGGVNSYIAY